MVMAHQQKNREDEKKMLILVEVSKTEYGLETKNMSNQRRKHRTQHDHFHHMAIMTKIKHVEN